MQGWVIHDTDEFLRYQWVTNRVGRTRDYLTTRQEFLKSSLSFKISCQSRRMCSKAKQSNVLKPEKKFVAEQAEINPLIIGSSLLTNTYNTKILCGSLKRKPSQWMKLQHYFAWDFIPREIVCNERSQDFSCIREVGFTYSQLASKKPQAEA